MTRPHGAAGSRSGCDAGTPKGRGRSRTISSVEELRALGQMLVDLNEAERLLTDVHRQAVAHTEEDVLRYLDSELFWKLRAAGDVLRDHFDMERVHGGQM